CPFGALVAPPFDAVGTALGAPVDAVGALLAAPIDPRGALLAVGALRDLRARLHGARRPRLGLASLGSYVAQIALVRPRGGGHGGDHDRSGERGPSGIL